MRKRLVLLLLPWVLGCQPAKQDKEIVYEEEIFDESTVTASLGHALLSDYGFFTGDQKELNPAENVFPYELNSPLFSDYALKKRFIYLPAGSKVNYNDTEVMDFPVGSVLIKNFYYSDDQLENQAGRIIETRLLIHEEEGWKALPYIWNEEQTDAKLEITGGTHQVSLNGKKPINYLVPNIAQCKGCHELNGKIAPIGPSARQLNRMNDFDGESKNQLIQLAESGFLKGLPKLEDVPKLASYDHPESGSLDDRARAYLEVNCAHCHRLEGPAKNSGLYLLAGNENREEVGIMKSPVAAGRGSGNLLYDIVPGKPDKSILVRRMNSTQADVMMPELGRKLVHAEGVELIREWIAGME
ncbi:MAG: SO2930 family diheme c-type cytochrome [Bacteroidota bacterium]